MPRVLDFFKKRFKQVEDDRIAQGRQDVDDYEMLSALYLLMWTKKEEHKKNPQPCPMLHAWHIKEELRRILGLA